MDVMDRRRAMLARVIEAQDRLEFGARLDKRSGMATSDASPTPDS
jgi:hypothetical protein